MEEEEEDEEEEEEEEERVMLWEAKNKNKKLTDRKTPFPRFTSASAFSGNV